MEFLRDICIPRLEAGGFFNAAAAMRCLFADTCFHEGKEFWEQGKESCRKVLSRSDSDPVVRASAEGILKSYVRFETTYADRNPRSYRLQSGVLELHRWEETWRLWKHVAYGPGWLPGVDPEIDCVFWVSDHCDGYYFMKDHSVGQVYDWFRRNATDL